MAISFVGSASAESDSLTLPTHQRGDLIVLLVAAVPQATITLVAGWQITAFRVNSASQSSILCWKIADSASEVSGTWSGATIMAACVYRDDTNYVVLGGSNQNASGGTTAINYNRLDSTASGGVASSAMRSGSWVGGAVVGVLNSTNIETAPSGMTNRVALAGASNGEIAIHDTNAGVTNWASTTRTNDISTAYCSFTYEISITSAMKDAGGGGGASFPPIGPGGLVY